MLTFTDPALTARAPTLDDAPDMLELMNAADLLDYGEVDMTLQDLVDQIVQDVAVVSREGPDEGGDVRSPLDGECRQLESGDPALGTIFQRGDVL